MIYEEELEHIHPDPDTNFPSTTMDSVIMKIHQNYTENIIDDPEDFCQYSSSLLIEQKGKKVHPTTTNVTTEKWIEDQTPMCSPTSQY